MNVLNDKKKKILLLYFTLFFFIEKTKLQEFSIAMEKGG